jgi:hypothetical protein
MARQIAMRHEAREYALIPAIQQVVSVVVCSQAKRRQRGEEKASRVGKLD